MDSAAAGWWSTARKSLDHHDTITALAGALDAYRVESPVTEMAEHQATQLARAGYALVRTDEIPGFLAREED